MNQDQVYNEVLKIVIDSMQTGVNIALNLSAEYGVEEATHLCNGALDRIRKKAEQGEYDKRMTKTVDNIFNLIENTNSKDNF